MPSIRSTLALLGITSAAVAVPITSSCVGRDTTTFKERAIKLYNKVTDKGSYQSDYFSKDNVPYHSIETLMVEAPDHGHESVSETYSFWIWLEAVNGKLTGNYDGVKTAWKYMEEHIIPTSKDQPGNDRYNPKSPATYAAEDDDITNYPSKLIFEDGIVGEDPIANELKNAYGTSDIYIMHWIIDGDNWYGYGQRGDGVSTPSFINTFQRGPSESTWKTVPHPSWEAMKYGGKNGFLDLFTKDNSYSKQWRYTAAPDADARAIQAAYFAYTWAQEDGVNLSEVASKAAKLGDYLRYSQYDKYFKKIGNCVGYKECSAGTGKNSAHYLISWYFSWGGDLRGDWSWRIGSSHVHSGYQNPLTAWILSTQSAFKPKSKTAVEDWSISMKRQLELFRWLQASEGCIAGGATNSWQGSYAKPDDSDITTFYGMWYDWQPVYHDPPSNKWTGMQGWGMERVCSLYYLSDNEYAGIICRKWIEWVKETTRINSAEGGVIHATNLAWYGNPDEWDVSNFENNDLNSSLHGTVISEGIDIGSIASIVKGLIWGAMKDNDDDGINLAINIIDSLEAYTDEYGYATEEVREDYEKFNGETYIPQGWSGKNAQGADIKSGVTFLDIRPKYKDDPDYQQVEDYINGGSAPVFHYHRFWAQAEVAVAQALISIYSLDTIINYGDKMNIKPYDLCDSAIINQGYKCCSSECKVVYTDDDGHWGVEKDEWCGCGNEYDRKNSICPVNIIHQGYKCCKEFNVVYSDADGDWGIEDDEWCGIKFKVDPIPDC